MDFSVVHTESWFDFSLSENPALNCTFCKWTVCKQICSRINRTKGSYYWWDLEFHSNKVDFFQIGILIIWLNRQCWKWSLVTLLHNKMARSSPVYLTKLFVEEWPHVWSHWNVDWSTGFLSHNDICISNDSRFSVCRWSTVLNRRTMNIYSCYFATKAYFEQAFTLQIE